MVSNKSGPISGSAGGIILGKVAPLVLELSVLDGFGLLLYFLGSWCSGGISSRCLGGRLLGRLGGYR